MIIIVPGYIKDFADFLEREYPVSKDLALTVLHNYDSIEFENGEKTWAAYRMPEDDGSLPTILLPGQVPELEDIDDPQEVILLDFAHEYCHHLQWAENRALNEDEAESFAACTLTLYKGSNFDCCATDSKI